MNLPDDPVTPTGLRPSTPSVLVRRRAPTPTVVYDSYWRFACERQAIYHRRVRGEPGPWTEDPVLRAHKFTNAYRAADRVSQYLIRHVIYGGTYGLRDTFLRVLLFKIFNRIETWQLIEHSLGPISEASFNVVALDRVLASARDAGGAIYSAAYIMPSGPPEIRRDSKHRMHLELLDAMLRQGLPEQVASAPSLSQAYQLLLAKPGFGPFLAYQYITDLAYSEHYPFSEMEFVVPGPGARDGLSKCFSDLGDYSEADAIRWMTERQEQEFAARGLEFQSLWGRALALIDSQNLCCEISKYSRVAHPEIQGTSGRVRIKQKFAQSDKPFPVPWFPPKWCINDSIAPPQSTALQRQQQLL